MDETDFVWKLLIGGQETVGKTTLLFRFLHNQFISDMKSTIGVEFHSQRIERLGKKIAFIFWDLGGHRQFKAIHEAYLRGAVGAFVCFDLSQPSTLPPCNDWIDMFRKSNPDIPILLVGTKSDLVDPGDHGGIIYDANLLTLDKGLHGFVETSSKLGINVDVAINGMIDIISEGLLQQ